jgi:hypothetical protein
MPHTGGHGLALGIRNDCKRYGLSFARIDTRKDKDIDLLEELATALQAFEALVIAITPDYGQGR